MKIFFKNNKQSQPLLNNNNTEQDLKDELQKINNLLEDNKENKKKFLRERKKIQIFLNNHNTEHLFIYISTTSVLDNYSKKDKYIRNKIIIEKLKEQKKLLANGELIHSYPHSWRSKAPLVHRATLQWFISMESHGLRNKALKAIDETKFYPNKGKERLKSMIELRPDWCVSRQRAWGVPIPVFLSKKTNEILLDDEVTENIASIFEKVVRLNPVISQDCPIFGTLVNHLLSIVCMYYFAFLGRNPLEFLHMPIIAQAPRRKL